MEFQLSYLKSWKMLLWKCFAQYLNILEHSGVATGLEKVSSLSNPKKDNVKECSKYCTIASISHVSKETLKMLQPRLQQYVNQELPDVQAGFWIGRWTRGKVANVCSIIEKTREFQRNIYYCFNNYVKAFDCVDHSKLENSERDGILEHLTCLLRNMYVGQEATVRTASETTDWFQIGKGVHQYCTLSPCLFNCMQST